MSCTLEPTVDAAVTVDLATRRPVAVDLFAGAGGLSLGFESAGFDVLAAVEYDPVHAATHEYNFPLATTLCADVAQLSAERLLEAAAVGAERHGLRAWDGTIDVVFGGPPCQGFSLIGKRLIDDPRNQLVFHFLRLVSALRPRYFLMENVPGMTRGGHESILRQLVQEFGEQGYTVVEPYQVLNAADFGVPQDRRRLFLMGAREGETLPMYPTPSVRPVAKRAADKAKALSDEERRRPLGPTVADAIGDLPDLDRYQRLLESDAVKLPETTLAAMERAASPYARRMRRSDEDPEDLGYEREWDPATLSASTRTVHTQKSIDRFNATSVGETEPISRYYRLDPAGLCNTLRAGSGSERGAFTSPRPIHPTLPRVLSVREAARLHSFPDWFRFHETKWHGFRQIGNAVAPLVGRAVAMRYVQAMGLQPARPSTPLKREKPELLKLSMSEATAHFGVDRSAVPAPRTRIVKVHEPTEVAMPEQIRLIA